MEFSDGWLHITESTLGKLKLLNDIGKYVSLFWNPITANCY